jgi:ubiquinone/menaquinone biosynthesis C-methylase UbiE
MVETGKRKAVLLDLTGESLKVGKKRIKKDGLGQRIEVLHGDIRSVPHPDNTFDFVLSEGDPISICGDPEKAVGELSRVLKPSCHFVAGVDSTFSRALRMVSEGKSLDSILDFLQIGISPAEEQANFDSKSFTPLELMSLLQRHSLKTVRIVGKPIGFGVNMTDIFIEAIPKERRRQIFENKRETEELSKMVNRIFSDPYIAGIGSHLQIVAIKEEN